MPCRSLPESALDPPARAGTGKGARLEAGGRREVIRERLSSRHPKSRDWRSPVRKGPCASTGRLPILSERAPRPPGASMRKAGGPGGSSYKSLDAFELTTRKHTKSRPAPGARGKDAPAVTFPSGNGGIRAPAPSRRHPGESRDLRTRSLGGSPRDPGSRHHDGRRSGTHVIEI